MNSILDLMADPAAWAALVTLVIMEVVLGIDNLVFISILSNKLPEHQRGRARQIGLILALVMRLVLLSTIAWIVGLTAPVFTVLGNSFSWRDLILLAGGLFLVWKATSEIHHTLDPVPSDDEVLDKKATVKLGFGAAIIQILILDLVFSIDSILTAVGMTQHLPIMFTAVLFTVGLMMVAANPLANFINDNPSVVMLALGFLLMIGMVLIAEAFGAHISKNYIYAAMGFSCLIEGLNMAARGRAARRRAEG
jgi:predicted tellurium resistance membrane protein TerC